MSLRHVGTQNATLQYKGGSVKVYNTGNLEIGKPDNLLILLVCFAAPSIGLTCTSFENNFLKVH